jgi:hypothetical protein
MINKTISKVIMEIDEMIIINISFSIYRIKEFATVMTRNGIVIKIAVMSVDKVFIGYSFYLYYTRLNKII